MGVHSSFYVRLQAETHGFGGKVVAGRYSCQLSWKIFFYFVFFSQPAKHLLFPSLPALENRLEGRLQPLVQHHLTNYLPAVTFSLQR